jgi:hypothetical protein
MRSLLAVAMLAALPIAATAQTAPFPDAPPPPQVREGASGARAIPQGARPLDDAAAPAALVEQPPQPDVTTREEGGQVIQEYRIKGKLYMQRVTPRHGRAYVLVDNKGDGTFSRLEQTLDAQVRVPQWVLLEF